MYLTWFICSAFNTNTKSLIGWASWSCIWPWHRYRTYCKIIIMYCGWCVVVRLRGVWTMRWRWLWFSARHVIRRRWIVIGCCKHFKNLFRRNRPLFSRTSTWTGIIRTITIATSACVKNKRVVYICRTEQLGNNT